MKLTIRDIVVAILSAIGSALGIVLVASLLDSCTAAVQPIKPRNERMVQFGHTNAAPIVTTGSMTVTNMASPLYVIPEAVLVQTPLGPILFAHQQHVAELRRLFPHHTLTNLVIWSK